jgi:hypothetical protein
MPLLSLAQARVCLDCDWLTDETFCPKCDRDSTVPLAAWFRPLREEEESNGRGRASRRRRPGRWLIVVQHDQQELFRTLRHALVDTDVEVLYERRAGDRRRRPVTPAVDRRRADRRRRRLSGQVFEGAQVTSRVVAPAARERVKTTVRGVQPA